MNEADTCRRLITPKLQQAGWDNPPHVLNEQHTFTDGRIEVVGTRARRREGKRADYLLRHTPCEVASVRGASMRSRRRGAERGLLEVVMQHPHRSVIAHHLLLVLYGHWAVNDPRGSGSRDFIDLKFAPLGPIHFGRKADDEQPTQEELRAFHEKNRELLNFPVFWIDDAKRRDLAAAIAEVIRQRGYTCYACAICSNHIHLVIRQHRDKVLDMWDFFSEAIRQRSRLCFSNEISAHHPVISARPYKVFLYTPDDVWTRIRYVETNPEKEGLPRQSFDFVVPYDNWPLHKQMARQA